MSTVWFRFSRLNQSLLVTLLIIGIFFYLSQTQPPLRPWNSTHVDSTSWRQDSTPDSSLHTADLPQVNCSALPGADDVFVIMKTGVGEARQKVPVHFSTTFRCIPHYAIYSDVEQIISGHIIYDALVDIPPSVQSSNPEFETYRQMKSYARAGREDFSDLLESPSGVKEDAPGWMLDKWKFLPLLEKALERAPDAKWYFFMEADTFLVWSNLLRWLSMFDHKKPLYLGGQAFFGEQEFAHGGAGYVLSHKAAKEAHDAVAKNSSKYERVVAEDCCGDLIVAKALSDAGIGITESWPVVQGETPSTLDYSSHHWCYPIVSQHHMSAQEITDMWEFEQQWIKYNARRQAIMHRDVFEHFVQPEIQEEREDWDNLSGDLIITETSLDIEDFQIDAWKNPDECLSACSKTPQCIQYSYLDEVCKFGYVVRLGAKVESENEKGMISGWMTGRVDGFKHDMEPCEPRWILNNTS